MVDDYIVSDDPTVGPQRDKQKLFPYMVLQELAEAESH
jgi:hypothetical protein